VFGAETGAEVGAGAGTAAGMAEILKRLERVERSQPKDRLCLCVFSGDLDKMIAAFIIATGAAASGMDVKMFFTFWGTSALRDAQKRAPKSLVGKMFGWMLPKGSRKLKLSKMQMAGMGRAMIRSIMRKQGMASLEEMIQIAAELEVQILVCTMSMELMEIKSEELIDYPNMEYVGVASFVELMSDARSTMFI